MPGSNAPTRAHVSDPDLRNPASDPAQTSPTPTTTTHSLPVFVAPTIPQSRKEKRKAKHSRHDSTQPTPSTSDTESANPADPSKPKKSTSHSVAPSIPKQLSLTTPMPPAFPLLIASLGNPGPAYASTLHSAGHIVTSYLCAQKSYTPFTRGLGGLVSTPGKQFRVGAFGGKKVVEDEGEDWTFWQSTSFMNVSGKGVQKAYREWLGKHGGAAGGGRLVVVHDELESPLGKITIRDGGASAKGHNGLKSCQASLGGVKWWRVGVGIGRPESREPDVVSRYVLGKIGGREKGALEGSAIGAMRALEEISEGRR